jgi:hypothetical protein
VLDPCRDPTVLEAIQFVVDANVNFILPVPDVDSDKLELVEEP